MGDLNLSNYVQESSTSVVEDPDKERYTCIHHSCPCVNKCVISYFGSR